MEKYKLAGLIPYAQVRVVSAPSVIVDVFDRSSKRRPFAGDEAVVTGISKGSKHDRVILVTKYGDDEDCVWIAAFTAEELELITPAGPQLLEASPAWNDIPTDTPQLFVWREWEQEWYQTRDIWEKSLICIYCKAPLEKSSSDVYPPGQEKNKHIAYYREACCKLCGWARRRWASNYNAEMAFNSGRWATFRQLRKFEISDPQIGLDELATHLKRRYTDIHSITPRRFEELVAEIFRGLGWQTRLTKKTRDGGVDIYLFENSKGDQAIIECKRYKNTVGV